jgi:hypothetical protein
MTILNKIQWATVKSAITSLAASETDLNVKTQSTYDLMQEQLGAITAWQYFISPNSKNSGLSLATEDQFKSMKDAVAKGWSKTEQALLTTDESVVKSFSKDQKDRRRALQNKLGGVMSNYNTYLGKRAIALIEGIAENKRTTEEKDMLKTLKDNGYDDKKSKRAKPKGADQNRNDSVNVAIDKDISTVDLVRQCLLLMQNKIADTEDLTGIPSMIVTGLPKWIKAIK